MGRYITKFLQLSLFSLLFIGKFSFGKFIFGDELREDIFARSYTAIGEWKLKENGDKIYGNTTGENFHILPTKEACFGKTTRMNNSIILVSDNAGGCDPDEICSNLAENGAIAFIWVAIPENPETNPLGTSAFYMYPGFFSKKSRNIPIPCLITSRNSANILKEYDGTVGESVVLIEDENPFIQLFTSPAFYFEWALQMLEKLICLIFCIIRYIQLRPVKRTLDIRKITVLVVFVGCISFIIMGIDYWHSQNLFPIYFNNIWIALGMPVVLLVLTTTGTFWIKVLNGSKDFSTLLREKKFIIIICACILLLISSTLITVFMAFPGFNGGTGASVPSLLSLLAIIVIGLYYSISGFRILKKLNVGLKLLHNQEQKKRRRKFIQVMGMQLGFMLVNVLGLIIGALLFSFTTTASGYLAAVFVSQTFIFFVFFSTLWSLIPPKRGKSSASKTETTSQGKGVEISSISNGSDGGQDSNLTPDMTDG